MPARSPDRQPRYALSWSGGKDATLALDRARRQGLEVVSLFNIYEGSTGRVRFHGVRHDLIQAQADALGIPLLLGHTHPDDYETVLLRLLARLREQGITGVIFGDIHLEDIRAWYGERLDRLGLEQIEPLWGERPADLLRELVDRGYRARIVSVDLQRASTDWLGRVFDDALIQVIEASGIDPCGEFGEYHSFVFDGPLFRVPLRIREGVTVEMEGHRFIDLELAD